MGLHLKGLDLEGVCGMWSHSKNQVTLGNVQSKKERRLKGIQRI